MAGKRQYNRNKIGINNIDESGNYIASRSSKLIESNYWHGSSWLNDIHILLGSTLSDTQKISLKETIGRFLQDAPLFFQKKILTHMKTKWIADFLPYDGNGHCKSVTEDKFNELTFEILQGIRNWQGCSYLHSYIKYLSQQRDKCRGDDKLKWELKWFASTSLLKVLRSNSQQKPSEKAQELLNLRYHVDDRLENQDDVMSGFNHLHLSNEGKVLDLLPGHRRCYLVNLLKFVKCLLLTTISFGLFALDSDVRGGLMFSSRGNQVKNRVDGLMARI